MNTKITRRTMMSAMAATALAAFVGTPAYAVVQEKSDGELKRELGVWVLDSVQAGMQNETLIGAIRDKAKEILAKNGVKLPVISVEQHEEEHEYWEKEKRAAKDRKGPPPWAPAHGWRRKFGEREEMQFGGFILDEVQRGETGPNIITAIHAQIEQVSKGGKVGELRKDRQIRETQDTQDTQVTGPTRPSGGKPGHSLLDSIQNRSTGTKRKGKN